MRKIEVVTNERKDDYIFKNAARQTRRKNLVRTNTRGGIRL